jgi:uncharacterized RDD family membrane protein YckC
LPRPPALSPAGVPLADFGTRLGAYLIDGALISVVNLVLVFPFFFLFVSRSFDRLSTEGPDPDPGQFFAIAFGPILAFEAGILLFNLVLSYLYMVEVQHRAGQTIGKRMVKIRVVPLDPRLQFTRGMAAKRWAIEYLPGTFVAFYTLIDGFWQLWDKPFQQTLHDKAAQTVVVKVSA